MVRRDGDAGRGSHVALIELLNGALGVPRSTNDIVKGVASRGKVVEVAGASAEDIERLAQRAQRR